LGCLGLTCLQAPDDGELIELIPVPDPAAGEAPVDVAPAGPARRLRPRHGRG